MNRTIITFKSELIDAVTSVMYSERTKEIIKEADSVASEMYEITPDDSTRQSVNDGIKALYDIMVSSTDQACGQTLSMGSWWAGHYTLLSVIYEENLNDMMNNTNYTEYQKHFHAYLHSVIYNAFISTLPQLYERLEWLKAGADSFVYINDVDGGEYHEV